MGAFNKPYKDAGVMIEGEGFLASSKGVRLSFSQGSEPTVTPGPFGLENLVSGYWKLKLDSIEEAIDFAKKIPFRDGSVEIRKVADEEDFGPLPKDDA